LLPPEYSFEYLIRHCGIGWQLPAKLSDPPISAIASIQDEMLACIQVRVQYAGLGAKIGGPVAEKRISEGVAAGGIIDG